MADFNPELYLRLEGEHWLQHSEASREAGGGPVAAAGAALVAAGVISHERALAISRDYEDALAVRASENSHARMRSGHRGSGTPPPEPEPLAPRQLRRATAAIAKSDWELQLEWVSSDSERAQLGMRGRSTGSRNRHSSPPELQITLGGGRRTRANFSGGWGSEGLHGNYEIEEPVPVDAEWIEIEGQRIRLDGTLTQPPVSLEQLPPGNPGLRHLWELVSDFSSRHAERSSDSAVSALIAAGALAEGDPELEAFRWVAEQGGGFRRGFGQPRNSVPPISVPADWLSLLTGSSRSGPRGTLLVGTVTPVFDGLSIAVNALESSQDAWSLNVEVAGGDLDPDPFSSALERRPLAWWAFDDRANFYLGSMMNWSGGGPDGRSSGNLGFQPLDPQASKLTLALTGATTRALIEVELAWV